MIDELLITQYLQINLSYILTLEILLIIKKNKLGARL